MDYEKKYNDALNLAKSYYGNGCNEFLDTIFPELRESEDERHRKWILEYLYDGLRKADEQFKDHFKAAIDWLEKQKDSLHIEKTCKDNGDTFTDEDEGIRKELIGHWDNEYMINTVVGRYSLHAEVAKKRGDTHDYNLSKSMENWLRNVVKPLILEKQKEQTSDIILKAFENSKTDYSLEEREEAIDYSEKVLPTSIAFGESDEGYLLHKVIEAAYIAGQKEQKPKFYPGDVIKCTSSGSLWVRCKDRDNIRSDGHTACIGGGFESASEEEAVQFFQELNENGYQWDCIKGRPMKKEQKGYRKLYEDISKSEWFKKAYVGKSLGTDDEPKQEWSEEDQKSLNRAINICINDFGENSETARFLKSLPERFNLQPKQEWSEEDEDKLEQCIRIVSGWERDYDIVKSPYSNFLKSLRPQPHWKPSKEQMDALNALNCHGDLSYVGQQGHLISLYNDIKKL